MDKIIIKGLNIYAYHGVKPEEKKNGQSFVLDITLGVDISIPCQSDNVDDTVNYSSVTKTVIKTFTERSYDLIERAASAVCDAVLETYAQVQSVDITLKKPFAPVKADFDYMAVNLHRTRSTGSNKKTALLSLGSNLDDREQNLKNAIKALGCLPGTEVKKVSSVYRTPPFGVGEGHGEYLNCCAEIATSLSPRALLGALLGIEAAAGRERRAGEVLPRRLDIDLLLYEDCISADAELILPHPRMAERAFVLVPLADIYPECRGEWFDCSKELAACDKSGIIKTDISLI